MPPVVPCPNFGKGELARTFEFDIAEDRAMVRGHDDLLGLAAVDVQNQL
jgi:hypothetical protein